MKAVHIQKAQRYIEKVQYVSGVCIVLALIGYAYLLCSSVAFAVSQKELAHKSSVVTEALAQLEARYLTETQAFSHERAVARGFTAINSKTFVSAAPAFSSAVGVRVSN